MRLALAAASGGNLLRWGSGIGARLFSTSAFLLAARLLGAAAGFGLQLILAQYLSAHDLGLYFTATSLAAIGGILAAHGYPSIATRFVSRYRRPGSAPFLRAFVRHAQREMLLLALLLSAIVALAAVIWPGVQSDARAATLLAALTIPFVAAFRFYGSLATATRSFSLSYLPDVCMKPVLVLATVIALLFVQRGVSLVQVMMALAGATIILSVSQYALLRQQFPVSLQLEGPESARRTARSKPLASTWRQAAHAVLLVAVFSQFFPEVSILLAAPVLSPADMGAFGLCLKLAFLIGFFVLLTQNIATPDLADALGKRDGGRGSSKLAASCSAPTIVTLGALLASALWGQHVLRLFGEEFVAGHSALVLLVAAQLVRAVFGPTNAVLTLVGEQKLNLLVTAASVALLAISTAIAGTLWGLDGAALAVLLTTLFWSATSAVVLHRRAGVRVDLFGALARARPA